MGGAFDRFETAGPHPQWRVRALDRARLDDDVVERPVFALVRELGVGLPGGVQETHRFVEAGRCFAHGDVETREFVVAISLSDPKIETAVGEQVHGGNLLSKQRRIVPRDHDDGGSEPDALRAAGEVAQKIERGGDLADASEVMLHDEYAVVAELLGREHVVDELAISEAIALYACSLRSCAAE